MDLQVLSAQAFYAGVSDYMNRVDPAWDEERWQAQAVAEQEILRAALGEAGGRSVLDCSCGAGGQAIPLARLGWRVTGTDITEASLNAARRRAGEEGVGVDFHACDMADLGRRFQGGFDWVISCMALDNILEDRGVQGALRGMADALRRGGRCYLRLRDFDHLMRVRPRYEVKEERVVPQGRVLRLEDWDYESETHVVCAYVFLREDRGRQGYRWETDVFRFRRRALRRAELGDFLRASGFEGVQFLPQKSPWGPYEVVASRGERL